MLGFYFQNVVLIMNDIVDWLIPDIPKDISLQIHKEKILLVELFMKEEQVKKFTEEERLSFPMSPGGRHCFTLSFSIYLSNFNLIFKHHNGMFLLIICIGLNVITSCYFANQELCTS
uniref:Uncharacterized protein n=1 Tax=Periophthalmus magnuspinnatus TaxID=409849 RepID=A0A3B4BET0_9GOBI